MRRLPELSRAAAFLAALLASQASAGELEPKALIERVRSGALPERIEAIEKLAGLRAEDGLPALREAASKGEVELRVAAISALGEYARPDQFALLHDLSTDADSRIAGAAVRSLGRGAFKALPHLIDALRHEAAGVREAAGAAMQRVSGVHAEPAILAEACVASKGDRFAFLAAILARDAGPRASADALRALPDAPESVSPLVKALGGEFEPVRAVARGRLEALACRRMNDAGWREWAKPAGSVAGWRAAAYLDPANPLRATAARALAVPDREAVAALAGCEAEGVAEEEALRSLAIGTGLRPRTRKEWSTWWLTNRDRSRTEWLLAALIEAGDAPNRAAAARALGGVRERRVVEHLLAYGVKDADPVVRGAVEHSMAALVGERQTTQEEWASAWKRVEAGWK
jgi:HEAT repeat protein